jgi:hypothetical protein
MPSVYGLTFGTRFGIVGCGCGLHYLKGVIVVDKNKIKPMVSREASYVYHMLSCAKCGYDNAYGEQFSPLHKESSLKTLKEYEKLITVKGGEHCGQLYSPLVSLPASLDSPADKYYQSLYSLFSTKDYSGYGAEYFIPHGFSNLEQVYSWGEDFAKEITVISEIMMENYQIYVDCVWSKAQPELLLYAEKVEAAFNENGVSAMLDKIVGIAPQTDFHPIFCNSLDGGAEAIDVSANRHVFGIGRDIEGAVKFITHEYVIYLLKQALVDTPAFSDPLKHWMHIESLAAYYYGKVFPGEHVFLENREIIEAYENKNENGMLSAKELFLSVIAGKE